MSHNNLDEQHRQKVINILKNYAGRKIVLTHRMIFQETVTTLSTVNKLFSEGYKTACDEADLHNKKQIYLLTDSRC